MLRRKLIVAAIVSASMIGSSTAAVAAAPTPAPASSAWMALSALSPTGAAVLDSAAAAAAQPTAVTCPDGAVVPAGAPCPAPAAYGGPGFPPIPVLIVLAAVLAVAIYVASKGRSHANSPF